MDADRHGERMTPAAEESEEELLREARALLPALEGQEPRPGFALRVALAAEARRTRSFGEILLGEGAAQRGMRLGIAGLAAAAAVLVALQPTEREVTRPEPGLGAAAELAAEAAPASPEPELALLRGLELYQELPLAGQAGDLGELDVVAALHQLSPEGRP
jgi:hypothetical protein